MIECLNVFDKRNVFFLLGVQNVHKYALVSVSIIS